MFRLQLLVGFWAFLISTFLVVSVVDASKYEELNLPSQSINPGSFTYPFKRLWEKVRVAVITGHEAKVSYYDTLVIKRMSELGNVVMNDKKDQIQKATERLSYFSGILTEYLIENGASEEKEKAKTRLESFLKPLEELRDRYPANSSYWLLVSYNIDSLNDYSNKLEND